MVIRSDIGTYDDYRERLEQRLRELNENEANCAFLWQIACSADRHFERFNSAAHRYKRAVEHEDAIGLAYEKQTMTACLYEAIDTAFMVIQLLDINSLRLESSLDGLGFVGEDAAFVSKLVETLEQICSRALALAEANSIVLDFRNPVDEREGVTYTAHRHWQDAVAESVEKSFFAYFAWVRQGISRRLSEIPRFWQHRTLRESLVKSRRPALIEVIKRLDRMPQPTPKLAETLEKSITNSGQHHWLNSSGTQKAKEPFRLGSKHTS